MSCLLRLVTRRPKNRFKKILFKQQTIKKNRKRNKRKLRMINKRKQTKPPCLSKARMIKFWQMRTLEWVTLMLSSPIQAKQPRNNQLLKRLICRMTTRYLLWWHSSIQKDKGRLKICRQMRWRRVTMAIMWPLIEEIQGGLKLHFCWILT